MERYPEAQSVFQMLSVRTRDVGRQPVRQAKKEFETPPVRSVQHETRSRATSSGVVAGWAVPYSGIDGSNKRSHVVQRVDAGSGGGDGVCFGICVSGGFPPPWSMGFHETP